MKPVQDMSLAELRVNFRDYTRDDLVAEIKQLSRHKSEREALLFVKNFNARTGDDWNPDNANLKKMLVEFAND